MGIKHAHQTIIADDPAYDVGATEWNEDHSITSDVNFSGFNALFADATGIKSSETGNPSLLTFTSVASAVNYLTVTNAATAGNPKISAVGSDTDIGIDFYKKGTGQFLFRQTGGNAGDVFNIGVNSSVIGFGGDFVSGSFFEFQITDGTDIHFGGNGAPITIRNEGAFSVILATNNTDRWLVNSSGHFVPNADATYDIGTSTVGVRNLYISDLGGIKSGSHNMLLFDDAASAVNYLTVTNAATGNEPIISVDGTDTDIGLRFKVKGAPSTTTFELGSGTPTIYFASTSSGATGPVFGILHDTASPANNDMMGALSFQSNIEYARIDATITDVTAASEDGRLSFSVAVAGTVAQRMAAGDGVIIGSGTTFPGVGNLIASGSLKSSGTAGIGYATGAGGTVTQLTNKATGVTLNKITGQITMEATAALAADTTVSFVLTNNTIAATDLLVLNHVSGGTAGSYLLNARPAAGSATIDVRNITTGSLTEAPVIGFAVIKAVTA